MNLENTPRLPTKKGMGALSALSLSAVLLAVVIVDIFGIAGAFVSLPGVLRAVERMKPPDLGPFAYVFGGVGRKVGFIAPLVFVLVFRLLRVRPVNARLLGAGLVAGVAVGALTWGFVSFSASSARREEDAIDAVATRQKDASREVLQRYQRKVKDLDLMSVLAPKTLTSKSELAERRRRLGELERAMTTMETTFTEIQRKAREDVEALDISDRRKQQALNQFEERVPGIVERIHDLVNAEHRVSDALAGIISSAERSTDQMSLDNTGALQFRRPGDDFPLKVWTAQLQEAARYEEEVLSGLREL